MLKKRNKNLKKKKRNIEKLPKKSLNNFGVSFSKKSKSRKLNIKNSRRNQTFSLLSSKGQGDNINTSKIDIFTEDKQKKNIPELKISIKKDRTSKIECSNSAIYSPN
jgi:hypothetical protein